jgi:hypothetical protein
MARDRIVAWLVAWRRRECAQSLVGSLLALGGGCLALAATFWLVYLGIVVGMSGVSALSDLVWGKKLHLSHEWRMALSLGFLLLLFIHTVRTRGAPPEPLDDDDFPWGRPRAMRTAFLAAELFVITHPMATASRIVYWLGFGPMCFIGSWRLYLRARYVGKLPVEPLAPVLELMLFKTVSMTKEELETAFPELPWPETARDLLLIDGVMPLKADGSRLTLSEEFRAELRGQMAR